MGVRMPKGSPFVGLSWAIAIPVFVACLVLGPHLEPGVAGVALSLCMFGGAVGVFLVAVVVIAGAAGRKNDGQ